MLRLLTYNVRRFTDGGGNSSVRAVVDSLAALRPDVVCLNEVDLTHPGCLLELALGLGLAAARNKSLTIPTPELPHDAPVAGDDNYGFHFFGHVKNGKYGNAILWNRKRLAQVGEASEYQLPGGSEIVVKAGTKLLNGDVVAEEERRHRIVRGLLGLELRLLREGDQDESVLVNNIVLPSFRVWASHTDHISDEQRRTQLAYVREVVGAGGEVGGERNVPSVLMGYVVRMNMLSVGTRNSWARMQRAMRGDGVSTR